MKVWELRCANVNDHAALVSVDRQDLMSGLFDADGSPQDWAHRPAVAFRVETRKKVQKPRADVSLFIPGALALDEKAKTALGDFLSRFGQLLELHVEGTGETLFFYNVTNLIECIDMDRSEKLEDGGIVKEIFLDTSIPGGPAIFKDRRTAPARIYINDPGKEFLDRLVAHAGITGVECGEPEPL
jgi:hypothetical protein